MFGSRDIYIDNGNHVVPKNHPEARRVTVPIETKQEWDSLMDMDCKTATEELRKKYVSILNK